MIFLKKAALYVRVSTEGQAEEGYSIEAQKKVDTLEAEVQNEPHLALDGGKDGLVFYRIIAENAYKFLNEDGILALEIGYDQKKEDINLLEQEGQYTYIYCKKDFGNNDRIILCRLK